MRGAKSQRGRAMTDRFMPDGLFGDATGLGVSCCGWPREVREGDGGDVPTCGPDGDIGEEGSEPKLRT